MEIFSIALAYANIIYDHNLKKLIKIAIQLTKLWEKFGIVFSKR